MGILISGSSNVGKTTLATRLARQLGCDMISTDSLARHPGRPWPEVRPPVAEYYSRLSDETIYWFLRVHHENMWPAIRQQIDARVHARTPFIIEGSALRPEFIAPLVSDEISAVFLYADNDVLRERMRSEAEYAQRDQARRSIIDKFIERSLRDNAEMYLAARSHDITTLDTSDAVAVSNLCDELVQLEISARSRQF
ncbi:MULTISPECIES: AAA family ATPase [unclassified Rhizobium]|uniref:AAA family ATPase n=1 Tax=unclassified Rhizobium TaxID=2613769 RepID=UPI001ADCF95E|nr:MULTISPECIES: AAA family ATPase [unclassified Rhizobium]MBO9098906.1 AAA family ATPase [Rhizobium sp. L58/93]MBO9132289.1 AAA family ATPase [Rhizobium sp. B209b/85]MBO9169170.1 AAA family ATPase [Rhizobium sp. L245/93]MBO9185121.1 AAA family ATPase [Rhizobium sp. E27B/91]QXZ85268.1 AAA family ATPase [Rhizobium sp. K1/93]